MSPRLAWHSGVVLRLVTKTYANVKTHLTSSSGALSAPYSSLPVPRPPPPVPHAALPVNTSSSRVGAECRPEPSQNYPDWGWLAGQGIHLHCAAWITPLQQHWVQKWTLRTQSFFLLSTYKYVLPIFLQKTLSSNICIWWFYIEVDLNHTTSLSAWKNVRSQLLLNSWRSIKIDILTHSYIHGLTC